MSSPATIAETSDNAEPSNTLFIIPDGSPLWFTPDPSDKDGKDTLFGWRVEAITALMEQLPASNIPVLIGAGDITTSELITLKSYIPAWHAWETGHGAPQDLHVMVRPLDDNFLPLGHGNTDKKELTHELWLLTQNTLFRNGTVLHYTRGWADALNRLAFNTDKWKADESLIENLSPTDKDGKSLPARVRSFHASDSRPTSITVGTFVDLELVTAQYELDS